MNINSLMASLEKDIKINIDEETQMKNLAESFITNQLEEVKSNKINNIYKTLNDILEKICSKLQTKFNIDDSIMKQIIEQELFSIKLRFNNKKEISDEEDNDETSDEDNDETSEEENDEEEKSNKEKKENKKEIKKQIKKVKEKKEETETEGCKFYMDKKGCMCGRVRKTGTDYCGYHKKYAK